MFRHLGFHADEMLLAFVLWLCSLPLVALIIIPLFGLKAVGLTALAVLVLFTLLCSGVCTWKFDSGRKP